MERQARVRAAWSEIVTDAIDGRSIQSFARDHALAFSTLQAWRTGTRVPTIANLGEVCDLLGLDTYETVLILIEAAEG